MDFIKDIWGFLKNRKKFWLLPAIIVLVVVGGFLMFGAIGAAGPFVYTVF